MRPAKPILSIPTLLKGLFGDAVVYTIKQGYFSYADMLPAKAVMSILYTLQHCNKIPSFRKIQHKTITITICKLNLGKTFV